MTQNPEAREPRLERELDSGAAAPDARERGGRRGSRDRPTVAGDDGDVAVDGITRP
jgi:hypothetical protein